MKPEIPPEYEMWNEALAERFFPIGHTQPVYLDPDDATLAELARAINVTDDPVVNFIESSKATLWLEQPQSFLRWHDEWFRNWRSERFDQTPPMVGLLALFSYASTRMEDDRGYFKPLSLLLGVEDVVGITRCYNRRVRHYWAALNSWIERSRRGIPTAYPQDARANVSLLLTQRFLSAAERELLLVFFARSGLTPSVAMTVLEMEDHIRRSIHLLPSELMNEWQRHSDRFAEVSCIELESWTGLTTSDSEANRAPLLLGLYFDRRTGVVQFPLATTSVAAPAGDYFFEGAAEESEATRYAVRELGGRIVFDAGDGPRFAQGRRLSSDAITALIGEDLEISSRSGFKLQRRCSKAILFMRLGANSYLETTGRRLPLGTYFSLLVVDEIARDPTFAAVIGNAQPEEHEGCPRGWQLYRDLEIRSLSSIQADGRLSPEVQLLVPTPQEAVIDLRGGIPVAGPTYAGRAWLTCRPPDILVSGSGESLRVELHLRPADGTEGENEVLVDIGDGQVARAESRQLLPAGDHQIFAIKGSKTLAQKKLRLVSSDTPRTEFRPLEFSSSHPWDTVSAAPAGVSGAIRGAFWDELESRDRALALSDPPREFRSVVTTMTDTSEDAIVLGPVQDMRPDAFKKRRKRRGRAVLQTSTKCGLSLREKYGSEIAGAVESEARHFQAADGTKWKISYYENDEVVVQTEQGFVPLERFKVRYE